MKKFNIVFFLLLLSIGSYARSTSFSGTVLGYDSLPMVRANVSLFRYDSKIPISSTLINNDGSFDFSTNEKGMVMLELSGVSHYSFQCPLILKSGMKIHIEAILKHYDYSDSFPRVKVIGDFNNFNLFSGKEMEKQANGTFKIDFPSSSDTFAYQLVGVEKYLSMHSINNKSDFYVYDGAGDYRSIALPSHGMVTIIFDPRELTRMNGMNSNEKINITVNGHQLKYVRTASIIRNNDRKYELLGQQIGITQLDGATRAQMATDASLLKNASSDLEKQLLMLDYIKLGLIGLRSGNNLGDQKIFGSIFKVIPASSPFWATEECLLLPAAIALSKYSNESKNYLNTTISSSSLSSSVRAHILFNALDVFQHSGDMVSVRYYYDYLATNFKGSEWITMAERTISPKVNLIGKPAPAFQINELEDSSNQFNNSSFHGKYLLLDFWATWCGPCIAEISNLTKAYNKFHEKSFEILSVSLDSDANIVELFRKNHSMPWLHAVTGHDNDISNKFGIVGIPAPFLVGPDGVIIASGDDLRGDMLLKTLSKFIDAKIALPTPKLHSQQFFEGTITWKVVQPVMHGDLTGNRVTYDTSTMITNVKGDKSESEMALGIGEIIKTYVNLTTQKVYSVQTSTHSGFQGEVPNDSGIEVSIKETGKKDNIAGHVAIEYSFMEGKWQYSVWASHDFPQALCDCEKNRGQDKTIKAALRQLAPKGLFPVRLVISSANGNVATLMEFVNFEERKLDDSLFVVPAGIDFQPMPHTGGR